MSQPGESLWREPRRSAERRARPAGRAPRRRGTGGNAAPPDAANGWMRLLALRLPPLFWREVLARAFLQWRGKARARRSVARRETHASLRGGPKGRRSNPGAAGSVQAALDCFAEPVIGPATLGRTRWLAMTRSAARKRIIAMSKSEDDLSPEEWQARHDAACAIVARKYCDRFGFWRDCRYKPCRSARRCSGDAGACLQSRSQSVPYEAGIAARTRMAAETPAKPTASPERPTAMRTTRSACTKQRARRCEPRCRSGCGNDQSRRRVLPFAAGYATRRPT